MKCYRCGYSNYGAPLPTVSGSGTLPGCRGRRHNCSCRDRRHKPTYYLILCYQSDRWNKTEIQVFGPMRYSSACRPPVWHAQPVGAGCRPPFVVAQPPDRSASPLSLRFLPLPVTAAHAGARSVRSPTVGSLPDCAPQRVPADRGRYPPSARSHYGLIPRSLLAFGVRQPSPPTHGCALCRFGVNAYTTRPMPATRLPDIL